MRLNLKFDVMKDSPYRVLFCVTLPLAICSIISLFISPVTARLISRYVGESYFTCVALVNTVLMAFQQVVGAVVSAAWIKTAFMLKGQDESQKQQALWNAMYAIVGVQLTLAMLMILLVDPIFTWIHIPGEIYGQVKLYYCAYLAISALTGFISFVTTLVNGFCSALGIFLIQLMGLLVNILCSFILLPVLPGSVVNPDAVGAVCRVLIGVTAILMLRKNGLLFRFGKRECAPDWKLIWSIIRYGFLIALQTLLCSVGYLLVTVQTNGHLPLDYISALGIMLPVTTPMAHFSTACSVFIPPNYDAGDRQRVKRFVKIAQIGCTLYSVLCFAVYALLGKWYYGTLFTDPQIIAYGAEYWLWQGIGYVAVSVLCVMRTVYDSVGLGKLSLVCGVCELGSNLLCAFWLIPSFGIIGRNLSYPLGYWIAALFLLISYPLLRKRIYAPAKQTQNA